MATLDTLKSSLREAAATKASTTKPLSHAQYSAGFDILIQGGEWMTYQDFIVPQLSALLAPLIRTRTKISVLEIGPGPRSVLGCLPFQLRNAITRYAAFEPDPVFATELQEWLCSSSEEASLLPCLEGSHTIHQKPFSPDSKTSRITNKKGTQDAGEKFDVVLFCHSMYGMKPKRKFMEQALGMLDEQSEGAVVVVFHREETLHLDGLTCGQTATFPAGVTRVVDKDETLDRFAAFIAGFVMVDADADRTVRAEWREVCRASARREEAHPDHLVFSSPVIMAALTTLANTLPELLAQVPLATPDRIVKSREARLHRGSSVVRPTEVRHVQQCVWWAVSHGTSLTVLGGGHSGHCLWPNVVAVDMEAFNQVHIHASGTQRASSSPDHGPVVVVGSGCKTGDIIQETMAAGLTVPLGSRPSVGAGLWLQGGIGHLARLHGLACDAIVGAVVVSLDSGEVFCLGHVPSAQQPVGACRPANEADLLWAIQGAGTTFNIVISVTFKASAAPTYLIRTWSIPLPDSQSARSKLADFDTVIASKLPRRCSSDAYLYWEYGQMHLGVSLLEASTEAPTFEMPTPMHAFLGPDYDQKTVDGIGLFDAEMYISGMHGGHDGGKTFSFKRCLFLEDIGAESIIKVLLAAMDTRPSPLCYFHLLHGGGAVGDVAADDNAFGCRDWAFACVVTGVWPCHLDGSNTAQAAVRWVYNVVNELLPSSTGAYGADLGPDPRDTAMAARAFGPNRVRLARMKRTCDPHNILAYAFPLPKATPRQKLIILVTGESCAGKDYCAGIWVDVFNAAHASDALTARAVSISEATKREYAEATGADIERLLWDRSYKEYHRPALTTFYQHQVQHNPRVAEEHFLTIVDSTLDFNVLLITGMRDEAPVARLSHLVPGSKLIEVRVTASEDLRHFRRGCHTMNCDNGDVNGHNGKANSGSSLPAQDYSPDLVFDNGGTGPETAKRFAEDHLLPFLHQDLQRLASMVRRVPNFPRLGIKFRHVLGISQQPGGLALSTSLLRSQLNRDWSQVDAVACSEAGGFIFASALATQVGVPLVLIREAGKLPPPTVSAPKPQSHVSSLVRSSSKEKRIEMGRDVVSRGSSVVVVDDVLATGETLIAILKLLGQVGISTVDTSVIVVAEFPRHCGRQLLRTNGFGMVKVHSLFVFDGI